MKLAALGFFAGLVLAFLGITIITTGGPCRGGDCGPRVNEILFFLGVGLMVVSYARALWIRLRPSTERSS